MPKMDHRKVGKKENPVNRSKAEKIQNGNPDKKLSYLLEFEHMK
jgi:hypothetical protein